MAEAVLDGDDHKVLHVLALEVLGSGGVGDDLAVAPVEGEGNLDLSVVVVVNLKAVGTPSDVKAFRSRRRRCARKGPASYGW